MGIIGNFDGSTSSRFMTGEEAERDGISKYRLLQSSTQRGLSCYPLFLSVLPTDELEVPWPLTGLSVGWGSISCDLRLLGGLPSPWTTFHRLSLSITMTALCKRCTVGSGLKGFYKLEHTQGSPYIVGGT